MKYSKFSLFRYQHTKGQMLTELIIAMGIMAIFLPALITGLVAGRGGKSQQQQRLQAVSLLQETMEAARSVKEKGWEVFIANENNDPLYPAISGSSWSLVTGSETVGDFTRSVVIDNVYRSGLTGPIVAQGSPGAVLDQSTKKITVTILWNNPFPMSVDSETYVTRYLENQLYTETTVTQFNAGTKSGVGVQATSGSTLPDDGEAVLGSGGYSNWCIPNFEGQLNLPKSGKATSVTAVAGEAFAGTGENSSGESLADITISDGHPPSASLYGSIDGFKTYDIFGEADYAYLATDDNQEELVIYSLSNPPAVPTFTEVGRFNASGSDQAESVFVLGNTGYLVVKNKLWNINLDQKTGTRPARDANGITLIGEGSAVYVVGEYAYVSIKGRNDVQVQIIRVAGTSGGTNYATNMQSVGVADVNNQSGQDVFVSADGNRAYVVTNATSSTEREFHIINTTNKSNPIKIGSGYWTNGMSPEGVEVVPGNRAIVVGQGGTEYQVIDISNETSPTACGTGLNVDTGVFDSVSIIEPDGDVYTYIVTGDASSEFKIIAGGPGGGFSSTGTFESKEYDLQFSSANNRFSVTYAEPANTEIKFQVSLANQVGGVCPTTGYTFVGPDLTSATYFEQASGTYATFPFGTNGTYTNPGRCFKYKAYLFSTDGTSTPVFYDVTINYSP